MLAAVVSAQISLSLTEPHLLNGTPDNNNSISEENRNEVCLRWGTDLYSCYCSEFPLLCLSSTFVPQRDFILYSFDEWEQSGARNAQWTITVATHEYCGYIDGSQACAFARVRHALHRGLSYFIEFILYYETFCALIFVQIPYMSLYYGCLFSIPRWAALIIIAILAMAWFYILGHTADAYFCPILDYLAEKLHLTHDVAGITLLALGNGAPDVASTYSGS